MKSISPSLRELIRSIKLVVFDFDGVFTDNRVYVFADGSEAVCCHRSDGIGLGKLRALGIETLILSTEVNPIVSVRAQKLKMPCVQGCADKGAELTRLARQRNLSLQQIAFVGNDLNDRGCLQSVALPIVVQDAHADVVELGLYRTQAAGGHGAVREVCDLFESAMTPAAS